MKNKIKTIFILFTALVLSSCISTKNASSVTAVYSSEEYISGKRKIFDWYTSLSEIQTSTSDNPPAKVICNIALAYKKGEKSTATEIRQRSIELNNFLRRYLSSKTTAELKDPHNEDALKNEIKNEINENILSSSKILEVVFLQKDVIEQN